MDKLTFKDYLATKEKLREAIKQTPVRQATYRLRKYCKFPVGETKELKEYIALKPKQDVIVEWHYADIDNPTAISMKFKDVDNVDCEKEYKAFWSDARLQKWLLRNTRELS